MLLDGQKPNKHQYIKWQIEYTDAYGEKQVFNVNNMLAFEQQVRNYISTNMEQYYTEKFIAPHSGNIDGVNISLSVRIARIGWYNTTDELEQASLNVDDYIINLETPQGAIKLSEITPQNFIEKCPAHIRLGLEIDYAKFSKDNTALVEQIWETIVYDINDYLDGHGNIYANGIMFYNSSDSSINGVTNVEKITFKIGMYMVNGELIKINKNSDFDIAVYERYKGIFWP